MLMDGGEGMEEDGLEDGVKEWNERHGLPSSHADNRSE